MSEEPSEGLEDAAGENDGDPGPPLIGVAIALAGIAVLALLVFLIDPLRDGVSDAIAGDTGKLRADLRGLGVNGGLIVLMLGIVHAFVWYPAEILDTAVGFVYDFWVAFPMVMGVWLINALIAYWIGRHAARPLLYRLFDKSRFQRLEEMAHRGGVPLLLAMRLIPVVPFSLFSYVAGAAHVPVGRFVWTTLVGYTPITVVFVYLGSQLEELSPTDPVLWAGAAVLIALFVLTHYMGKRFSQSRKSSDVPDAEEQSP